MDIEAKNVNINFYTVVVSILTKLFYVNKFSLTFKVSDLIRSICRERTDLA